MLYLKSRSPSPASKSKKTSKAVSPSKADRAHSAIAQIREKYGEASIVSLEDMAAPEKFSTGVAGLDLLTWGGWAYDRISMLWGPKSGAKTTVSVLSANSYLHAMKEGIVFYIDAEGEFDPTYAKMLVDDVNRKRFFLARTAVLEKVTTRVHTALRSREPIMVIIDSIAQARSNKEYSRVEEDPEASKQRGTHAVGVGDMVMGIIESFNAMDPRKLGYCSVLILNQMRVNPGIMFGDPEQTTGGNALAHNVTQEVSLRRTEILRDKPPEGLPKGDKGPVVGREILATLRKTRVAGRDNEQIRLHYYVKRFGTIPAFTFDDASDLLPWATIHGTVERSGKYWAYGDKKWGSKELAIEALRADPDLRRALLTDTLTALRDR